ncbi:hypothetical protein BABINDRAFT_162522, partial [Babjeviella inositovora NRRL Y-12698]
MPTKPDNPITKLREKYSPQKRSLSPSRASSTSGIHKPAQRISPNKSNYKVFAVSPQRVTTANRPKLVLEPLPYSLSPGTHGPEAWPVLKPSMRVSPMRGHRTVDLSSSGFTSDASAPKVRKYSPSRLPVLTRGSPANKSSPGTGKNVKRESSSPAKAPKPEWTSNIDAALLCAKTIVSPGNEPSDETKEREIKLVFESNDDKTGTAGVFDQLNQVKLDQRKTLMAKTPDAKRKRDSPLSSPNGQALSEKKQRILKQAEDILKRQRPKVEFDKEVAYDTTLSTTRLPDVSTGELVPVRVVTVGEYDLILKRLKALERECKRLDHVSGKLVRELHQKGQNEAPAVRPSNAELRKENI